MNHFWELEDKIWNLVVTDPASGTDRSAVDTRDVTRYDASSLDVPVMWFKREFRDNPPVQLPLIVLSQINPVRARRAVNRMTDVKVILTTPGYDDGTYIAYRTSPDWFDINFQISIYSRTRRIFHDIAWNLMNEVFPMGKGSRWLEVASNLPLIQGRTGQEALVGPGPVTLKKEVTLNSYNWGMNRTEDIYTGNFQWSILDMALFRFRDLESGALRTITELNLDYTICNGSEATEFVVHDFVTDITTVT